LDAAAGPATSLHITKKFLTKGLRPLKSPRAAGLIEFEVISRARGFEKPGVRSQKKNPESPSS
jgi:hypothetical protein